MIAAKFGDPVIGIDIHRVMVPTPAGPVPTPLPHPFIGVVFDPLGAAMTAAMGAVFGGGGLVLINGMPCANAGTEVKGFRHVPTPPGVAPDPGDIPANEGTLVTGSKTVLFGGASQSRLASMVTEVVWREQKRSHEGWRIAGVSSARLNCNTLRQAPTSAVVWRSIA